LSSASIKEADDVRREEDKWTDDIRDEEYKRRRGEVDNLDFRVQGGR
jgi:hypothetical protein